MQKGEKGAGSGEVSARKCQQGNVNNLDAAWPRVDLELSCDWVGEKEGACKEERKRQGAMENFFAKCLSVKQSVPAKGVELDRERKRGGLVYSTTQRLD